MKILMLTQWFQPEPAFKGLPLACELRNRGHDVEVLTGFPNYPGGKVYAGYRIRPWCRERMDGIAVNRVALYPSHARSGLHRSLNYLSFGISTATLGPGLVGTHDVVYVYNLITLGWAARVLRWLRGSKVVLDVQDLWPESVTGSGMMNSPLLQHVLGRWSQYEYQRADQLIVLSPGFKRELVARGVDESKIEVVYNWCDESSPQPTCDLASLASELRFQGRFNVVFAGTMGVMQSLDVVLQAARKLAAPAPDVLFTLLGDGIEVERLRGAAAELPNVQLLPRRPLAEMGSIYELADALLVHLKDRPSHEITIPSKTQAYLRAGKPVLCGVKGDAADLVRQANAGIVVQPDDPDSLLDAVLKLRSMTRQELTELGHNGRSFYEEHLSFEQGVNRIERVFESMIGCTSQHTNGAALCSEP